MKLSVSKTIELDCEFGRSSTKNFTALQGLLSFEADTKLATLPPELARRLGIIRSNQTKRENLGRNNLRLSEAEIKEFKNLMICEELPSGNLWRAFCRQYIGSELLESWNDVVEKFGLNPLSFRTEDHDKHIQNPPNWEDAVELMSSEGLSSSDAMIVNMFQVSNFEVILSSDTDIGTAIESFNRPDKICILPDRVLKSIVIA